MRTLQEKYNAINEGNFSKDQFLRDARMQLPNLVTQYNGYDDAVQILKNRGTIQEEVQADKEVVTTKFKDGQKIKNTNSGAVYTVDGTDATGGIYVRTENGLRRNIPAEHFSIYEPVNEALGDKQYLDTLRNSDVNSVESAIKLLKSKFKDLDTKNIEHLAKEWAKRSLDEANLGPDEISSIHQEGDSWVVTYRKGDKKEKAFKTEKEARDFEKTVNEARITNKSLPDYRYKVTNDMDKYPYEQILRGLRVELESMEVTGTPTAEEYKKALAKVLKNLHADEIFYTNQIAGTNIKVNNHDKMVAVQGKEKEIKNSVDTFNGLKKAALKEGFKRLIKKVLTENFDSSNSKENAIGNNDVWYPNAEEKYEEMLQTWGEEKANKVFPLYLKRIDPTLTPSDFFDIYNNLSEKADPLHDYIKSKDDDYTKTEVENYKKQHEADALNEVGVDITGASNATGAYEIMMHMLDASITNRLEAAKFFSLNHSDMPSQQIEFLINHYFEKFQDEEYDIPHPRGNERIPDDTYIGDDTWYDEDGEKELRAEWEKYQATCHPEDKMSYMEWRSEQGLDEIATDIQGFPKWRELSQDEKDHISKFVKDTGDRDQAEYEKRRDERLKAQSARLDAYIKSQRGIQEDFETVTLSDLLD